MRAWLAALASTALVTGGCSTSDTCTIVDNGNATYNMECPDGTVITLRSGEAGQPGMDGSSGSSCSVTPNGNGTSTVRCTNGTSAIISDGLDGDVALMGTLSGIVTRLGASDHTGIVVTVVQDPMLTATTDATGSFNIIDVPAGTYTVRFEYPGYRTEAQRNIPVLGGTHFLTDELRIAQRLTSGRNHQPIVVAPDGGSILITQEVTGGRGDLVLFDFATGTTILVAEGIRLNRINNGHAGYSPDSNLVIFQTDNGSLPDSGPTTVYDRSTSTATVVAADGSAWQFTTDSSTLLLFDGYDNGNSWGDLSLWRPGDATPTTVDTMVRRFTFTADGSRVLFQVENMMDQELYAWTLASDTTTALGTSVDGWSVLSGSSVAVLRNFVGDTGELVIHDGAAATTLTMGANHFDVSADGNFVVFIDGWDTMTSTGELVVWDIAAAMNNATTLGLDVFDWALSPVGAVVIMLRNYDAMMGTGQLALWRAGDASSTMLQGGLSLQAWQFGPDALTFAVTDDTDSLDLWDVAAATSDTLTAAAAGDLAYSPDGSVLAYSETVAMSRDARAWVIGAAMGNPIALGTDLSQFTWSPTSGSLVVEDNSGGGNDLRLWRVGDATSQLLQAGISLDSRVYAPDGDSLLTVNSNNGETSVWVVADGSEIALGDQVRSSEVGFGSGGGYAYAFVSPNDNDSVVFWAKGDAATTEIEASPRNVWQTPDTDRLVVLANNPLSNSHDLSVFDPATLDYVLLDDRTADNDFVIGNTSVQYEVAIEDLPRKLDNGVYTAVYP